MPAINCYCDKCMRNVPISGFHEYKSKPEQPKKEEWCKHFCWDGKEWNHTDPNSRVYQDFWKFCPICGTPRQKEKSLRGKFFEYLNRNQASNPIDYAELERIAEDHFADRNTP